ncbi:peptidoglycan DD-metalloendopeptidase family protein [bacterium]|nr:peptidoglycan DD-metalloendopeptidase family protein [bacterium]
MIKHFQIAVISVLLVLNFVVAPSLCHASTVTQKQQQTREKINYLKRLETAEKNKLYKNQKKLETTTNNLQISKSQYNDAESQLKKMERELSVATAEFNSMDSLLKDRIRQVFKSQRTGMFELILSAKDLNSFLDIIYFERLVIQRDYKKMVTVKEKAQRIAQMKKDVESKKKYLAQSIKNINSQQKDIEKAIAQNQNMINKLKTDRSFYEKTERELARQSDNLESMISKKPQDTSVKTASAGFIKPISGRITSPFGWRTHPIFNSRTFHSGVDIGGPNYGNIMASNAGKVIYSGWYGGYGKVVIIDHGTINGHPTTTLYAHMSTIKVKQGDYVQKGQVVGLEGTTGYSTGPHCHFEVRINGKPNNPLNYI